MVIRPTRHQVKKGWGRFCREHAAGSPVHRQASREAVSRLNASTERAVRELCEREGLLTSREVAVRLRVSLGELRHYDQLGLLQPKRVVFGGPPRRVYRVEDVERFEREWPCAVDGRRHLLTTQRLVALEETSAREGLLTGAQVAVELGVSIGTVRAYDRGGFLVPEWRDLNGLRIRVYPQATVDRFKLAWRRGGDGRRSQWFNPDWVIVQARGTGRVQRLAREKDIRLDQAEALIRHDTRRRSERLPRRSGGRPRSSSPPEHHLEWAQLFDHYRDLLNAEYEMRAEHELLGRGDKRPSDSDVLLAVAEHDFRERRDRWNGYEHAPGDPEALHPRCQRPATNRVRTALKRLQIPHTENTVL
jgi:DNA-binding transcriptional MerR regulator